MRVGTMAIASGMHDVVIVAGVEKMTDTVGKSTTSGLATAADAENESLHGVKCNSQAVKNPSLIQVTLASLT